MRSLRRHRVVPPTLAEDGPGWLAAERNLTRAADERIFDQRHWNQPDVRGALYAFQGDVCAYCGCRLNDVADVDHYRPKRRVAEDSAHEGYWWLTYEFDNYFLCCPRPCNQTYKRDSFPMRRRALHVHHANRERLPREARALLEPCRDPIEELLEVDIRFAEDSWPRLCSRAGTSDAASQQVDKTIAVFRLNLDRRLLYQRREVFDAVLKALDDNREQDASKLAIRYARHSLVAYSVLAAYRPDLLPEPLDELIWLIDEILHQIQCLEKLLEEGPEDAKNRDLHNQLLWTLAVIWREPPAGNSDGIAEWLACESPQVFEQVRRYYDQL